MHRIDLLARSHYTAGQLSALPTTETSRETYLSTERAGAQAPPRISQPNVDRWRPPSPGAAPRERSQAPVGLKPARDMTSPVGRLKKRPQFLKIAAKGRKCAMPGLVLQAWCRGAGDAESGARLGLTASRKVGNAVARNRSRRRLRAVAESVLPVAAAGYDYVLIARKTTPDRPFAALVGDLENALKRLDLYRADADSMTDNGEGSVIQ